MNSDEARQLAAEAQQAYRDSSRPALPLPHSIAAALSAGVGVVLVGRSVDTAWLHVVVVLAGIALLALAYLIPTRNRERAGLYGFRGQVKRDHTVFLITAAVLVVIGFTANATLSTVYLIFGIVVAILYFTLLRGIWGAPK
ncbi:hypothetical protein ACNHUS_30940 [Actinomycetes bacterium M1A6_2h]